MKLPPIEKIYEAYSAIADHRVEEKEDHAIITSSNGERKYLVHWKSGRYISTDPATQFQGYPGYPVLAVWMMQGKLDYNIDHVKYFAGINWNQLNKKHKRNYKEALDEVFQELNLTEEIQAEIIADAIRLHKKIETIE